MELYNFIEGQIKKNVENVNEGFASPLYTYIELKRILKDVEQAIKEIQPEALKEAEMHGKGETMVAGALISVRAVGGRWNFKNVPEWAKQKSEIDRIESKYKALYKTKELGTIPVDEETGEILDLPEYSHGTDAIFVKFPK